MRVSPAAVLDPLEPPPGCSGAELGDDADESRADVIDRDHLIDGMLTTGGR